MNLAESFPKLLAYVHNPLSLETSVNALTELNDTEIEEPRFEGQDKEFKTVLVTNVSEGGKISAAGTFKALFIRIMASICRCGVSPLLLRVEWDDLPQISEDGDSAGVALLIVNRTNFEPGELGVEDAETILNAVRSTDIRDNGVSDIVLANDPAPKEHVMVTPQKIWSARALYVSLMLELYDRGDLPSDLEITWRKLPEVVQDPVTKLWKATATTVVRSAPKIVLS